MIPTKITRLMRRGRLPGEWMPAMKAIRTFCLMCSGGNEQTKFCQAQTCWLFPLRMGFYPDSGRAEKFIKGGADLFDVSAEQARLIMEDKTGTFVRKSKNAPRSGGRRFCDACGQPSLLSPHHLVPRLEGGSSHSSNLLYLCERCHNMIEVACAEDKRLRSKIAALAFLDEMIEDDEDGGEEDVFVSKIKEWAKRVYASTHEGGAHVRPATDSWIITKRTVDAYREKNGLPPMSEVIKSEVARRSAQSPES